jgi:ATP-dependent exoDNAse (exonuclease V) alpha subunit
VDSTGHISARVLHAFRSDLGSKFAASDIYSFLTPSQRHFADKFFGGQSLLLTGEAGTGKSFLINALCGFCLSNRIAVAKTASTGIAAFNIGGQTVHSWAGLGFGEEDAYTLIRKIRKNKRAVKRMQMSSILVLDEVSMIKADLLDKLDLILKHYRNSRQPYGGLQVVMVGDFMQLPPVWKTGEDQRFAFNARSWKEAKVQTIELKEKVRQNGDTPFARLLSRVRLGDSSDLSLLSTRINAQFSDNLTEPVRIFCKNVDVDDYNRLRLNALPGPLRSFKSKDWGEERYIEQLNKNCPAPEWLSLKPGAQVMLLTNLDVNKGLVNGSVGVVRSYAETGVRVDFRGQVIVVEENERSIKEQEATHEGIKYKTVAQRTQIPLKLAYAVTAHKAQGCTLDRAVIDMGEAFAAGQVYTALSRVRNIESLSITSLPAEAIRVNTACLEFYRSTEMS